MVLKINNNDLFKTLLSRMGNPQKNRLSLSFLDEAKKVAVFANWYQKLAFTSSVLTLGLMVYESEKNPKTGSGEKVDYYERSWSIMFVCLGALGTAFFSYQWISYQMEARRLQDLAKLILN